MTEKTATVELTLEESGWLFWMLYRVTMSPMTDSPVFTPAVNEAIHRRQLILLAKLEVANNSLRGKK